MTERGASLSARALSFSASSYFELNAMPRAERRWNSL